MTEKIPRYRSPAPSKSDWVEAVTASHRIQSAPPGVRKVWAYIGYALTRAVRYAWIHRAPILVSHAIAVTWVWLSHHFLHWIR